MHETESSLALLALEALPSGVLIVDREERVLYANRRCGQLFKQSSEELKAQRLTSFLTSVDNLLRIQEKARSDERQELTVRLHDESTILIGFKLSALEPPTPERTERYVCVLQDISGFVALRRERDGLLRRAVVGELLPSILHELKNPLAGMTTAVELLLEEVSDENLQRDLKGIFKEIRRLDLGMQAFSVAGRDLRNHQPADVGEAIREAVRVLEPIAKDAHVEFSGRATDLPPVKLSGDVVRGLVFNLVQSSIAACGAGNKVHLVARVLPDGNTFELSVADNSTTPPPQLVESSPGMRIGRIGVALLLCKRACETAGGTLTIGEGERGGTAIVVRVPNAR